MTDSIIFEHSSNFNSYKSRTIIKNSIIQSGSLNPLTGYPGKSDNKRTDPLFINAPAANLNTGGNFHITPGSPAIDMGK